MISEVEQLRQRAHRVGLSLRPLSEASWADAPYYALRSDDRVIASGALRDLAHVVRDEERRIDYLTAPRSRRRLR